MRRTQIYLTEAEHSAVESAAASSQTTKAEVIRAAIDRQLGLIDDGEARVQVIAETAGILTDAPDWPEWLADVRGRGTKSRLEELGL